MKLIDTGYYSSVSVFTADYDAPTEGCGGVDEAKLLGSLVQSLNSTSLAGGLNRTAGGSNSSVTTPSVTTSLSAVATGEGGKLMRSAVVGAISLAAAIMFLCRMQNKDDTKRSGRMGAALVWIYGWVQEYRRWRADGERLLNE